MYSLMERLTNIDAATSDICIVNTIYNYFVDNINLDNILAYYQEGRFNKRETTEDEVFFKLIVIPSKMSIKNTWLIENLDDKDKDNIHNVIIKRKFDSIPLFALNESIVPYPSECLSINRYQGEPILKQSILSENNLKDSVLDYKKAGDDFFYIGVDSILLTDILEYNDYDLAIEFEYKNHSKEQPIKAAKAEKKYKIKSLTDDYGYYINGTIRIGGAKLLHNIINNITKDIKVYNLIEHKEQALNRSNYNDDIGLNVMLLELKALKVIEEHGYQILGDKLYKDGVSIDNGILNINYDRGYIVLLESTLNSIDIGLLKELNHYRIPIKNIKINKKNCFNTYFYRYHILGDIYVANYEPQYIKLVNRLLTDNYKRSLLTNRINIRYIEGDNYNDLDKLVRTLGLDKHNFNLKVNNFEEYESLMEKIYNAIIK